MKMPDQIKDLKKCKQIEKYLFHHAIRNLEKVHCEKHTHQYWKCLLILWLHKFSKIIFLKYYKTSKKTNLFLKQKKRNIVPIVASDSFNANWMYSTPQWNYQINIISKL